MNKLIIALLHALLLALLHALLLLIPFTATAEKVHVKIENGPEWKKRSPQCAVWIENENQEYIGTIFVTKAASKKAWKFSPKEGRPDSLPVWYNSAKVNPENPSEKKLDAVTCATPKKTIFMEQSFSFEKGKAYIIKAEVNQSFDYNDYWTKKNSGVNGQPSIIYEGYFTADKAMQELPLKFTGTGSVDGSNGKIDKTSEPFLTTAKNIVSAITAYIE